MLLQVRIKLIKKMELLFIYLLLFSVINPIGTVPIFVGLTQDDDKKTFEFRCGPL
jgi:small neutral amino acid transporter SnatA (MarC family)